MRRPGLGSQRPSLCQPSYDVLKASIKHQGLEARWESSQCQNCRMRLDLYSTEQLNFFQGAVRISEPDGALLQQRIEADIPNKSYEPQHMRITPAKVWKTVSHWRRWPHLVSTSLVFSTWSSLTTYTPTIIMYINYPSHLQSQGTLTHTYSRV